MYIRLANTYLASAALILESGHSSGASVVFEGREYVALPPDGFGTFIYPQPVTVTDGNSIVLGPLREPDPSQGRSRQLLEKRDLSNHDIQFVMDDNSSRTRQMVVEYKNRSGTPVIISDDGFVGVLIKSREEALSFLNTIFATMLTYGVQGEAVQDSDLCGFQWDSNSGLIGIIEYDILSMRVRFSLTRDDPNSNQFSSWRNHPRQRLRIDRWKEILERAYDYTTKPDLHNDLILVYEGYTLLLGGAFKGAYLYGWMIIENFLSKLWETYVESLEGRSRDEKKGLTNSKNWTSYHDIEMLSIVGKIKNSTVRKLFNNLRKLRNDVVHNRKDISIEEARACLRAAVIIMLNRLRNQDPFLDLEKNDLVEVFNLQKDSDEQPARKE
jgi:hypothetical protein